MPIEPHAQQIIDDQARRKNAADELEIAAKQVAAASEAIAKAQGIAPVETTGVEASREMLNQIEFLLWTGVRSLRQDSDAD